MKMLTGFLITGLMTFSHSAVALGDEAPHSEGLVRGLYVLVKWLAARGSIGRRYWQLRGRFDLRQGNS
jgi:hypothetical protein